MVNTELLEKEIKTNETIDSSDFEEKVSSLRDTIDTLNEEVSTHSEKERWSAERKLYYMEAIENLQKEVRGIEEEWQKLSEHINKQSQRLEALFSSFPEAIDVSTLKVLSLRVSQLEQLVSGHINEERGRENAKSARLQLIISGVMLSVTVVLWGTWILLQYL